MPSHGGPARYPPHFQNQTCGNGESDPSAQLPEPKTAARFGSLVVRRRCVAPIRRDDSSSPRVPQTRLSRAPALTPRSTIGQSWIFRNRLDLTALLLPLG